jgi:hypothetical protein
MDFVKLAVKKRSFGGEPGTDDDLKLNDEYLNQPGRLAAVSSFGSVIVRYHPKIEDSSRPVEIHEHVRKRLLDYLFEAALRSEHKSTILREMGRVVFSRSKEDEYGPPAGKPIEGTVMTDESDRQPYFKVPIAHANPSVLARDDDGEITTVIGPQHEADADPSAAGPYLYVPADEALLNYDSYFYGAGQVPQSHETVITREFKDIELNHLQEQLIGLNRFIHDRIEGSSNSGIFKPRKYPPLLKAILMAIEHVPPEDATFGEELTAKQVRMTLNDLAADTDQGWVESLASKITSARAMGNQLTEVAKKDDTGHLSIIEKNDGTNRYVFEYAPGNYNRLEISEIGDVLELPCMQSLHESLQESKPTRWELYSFVRYIYEIDSLDVGVEEFKEWFSQYPWYQPDVTEYQVDYELERTLDGERPFPIGCNNDNKHWATHCIGRENCDYSLYQSVQLRPDVYRRLDDNE